MFNVYTFLYMIKIYFDSKYVFRCNVNKMKEPEDSVDEGGEDTSSIPVQGKVSGLFQAYFRPILGPHSVIPLLMIWN